MAETNEVDDFLAHFGVKGMKWGVKRGEDGVRPIARSLNDSGFGQLARGNVERHNQRQGLKKQGSKDQADARKTIRDTKSQAKAAKSAARKAADQEILDARARQEARVGKLSQKAAATYAATTKKGQIAAQIAYQNAEKKYLTGSDAKTAEKLTRGEKATSAVILGVGAIGIAGMLALNIADMRR